MQWKATNVNVQFLEQTREYKFYWREPMEFIEELVTDPSLMEESHFHSVMKWLHNGDSVVRVIDEPWTADTWQEIDASDV